MVANFDIKKTSFESLIDIQKVLESLGYKIDFFDKSDKSLTTKKKIIKRFMRPISYVLFVSSYDRIKIIIYSEVQTFKRVSNISLGNKQNQVIQNSSNNLNIEIQKKIFKPILKEMNRNGYNNDDWENLVIF